MPNGPFRRPLNICVPSRRLSGTPKNFSDSWIPASQSPPSYSRFRALSASIRSPRFFQRYQAPQKYLQISPPPFLTAHFSSFPRPSQNHEKFCAPLMPFQSLESLVCGTCPETGQESPRQIWPQNSNRMTFDPLLAKTNRRKCLYRICCQFWQFWAKGGGVKCYSIWIVRADLESSHHLASLRTQFDVIFTFWFFGHNTGTAHYIINYVHI